MKQFFFLIPFILASDAVAKEIVVTKEFCDFYVIEHVPDADVEYKPDASDDMWPPADIGGAIKVKPPKTIVVPIDFDLRKYMGVPEKQTSQNQQAVRSNLDALQTTGGQLTQLENNVATSQAAIENANQTIKQALAQPVVNQTTLTNAFTEAVTQYQTALSSLGLNPTQIQQASNTLNQNYSILQKQFNPFEKDPVIKEKNRVLKDGTQQALVDNRNHMNTATLQVGSLAESLKQTTDLFAKSPNIFAITDQFSSQFSGLQQQLSQTKQAYDGLASSEQKKLNELGKKIGSLDDPKNSFIDYAELGYVTMNEDGRIYFNGQPLFHEDDFAVKEACRKLRG